MTLNKRDNIPGYPRKDVILASINQSIHKYNITRLFPIEIANLIQKYAYCSTFPVTVTLNDENHTFSMKLEDIAAELKTQINFKLSYPVHRQT